MASRSLSIYVEPSCRGRLNGQFGAVINSIQVRKCSDGLRMWTGSVADWWLSIVRGEGEVQLSAAELASAHSDYALMTLSLSGLGHSMSTSSFMAGPEKMMLSPWNNMSDVTLKGDRFSFVVAHIPLRYLRTPGCEIAFDRPVAANRGPGAVLASAFSTLVAEAVDLNADGRLVGMLPTFTDFAISTFLTEGAAPTRLPRLAPNRISRVMSYLRDNLSDETLKPSVVARECGLSERQLYREFSNVGESFGSALRRLRLEEAAARLSVSEHTSIGEIAYDCGFTSPTHFARVFRSAYGVSPRAYGRTTEGQPRPADDRWVTRADLQIEH